MELANKISQKFDMLWITILKTAALLQNLRQPPPVVNLAKHIHTNRWALIKQTLTTGPSFNPRTVLCLSPQIILMQINVLGLPVYHGKSTLLSWFWNPYPPIILIHDQEWIVALNIITRHSKPPNAARSNQRPFQDPKLEVPTIYKAYFPSLCKAYVRESHHKIWPEIWCSTYILGSWNFQWSKVPQPTGCSYNPFPPFPGLCPGALGPGWTRFGPRRLSRFCVYGSTVAGGQRSFSANILACESEICGETMTNQCHLATNTMPKHWKYGFEMIWMRNLWCCIKKVILSPIEK